MPGLWLDRLARKGGVVKSIPILNWEFDSELCHFGAASNLAPACGGMPDAPGEQRRLD